MKSPKSPQRLDLTEEVERHLELVTDPAHVGERTVMVVVCDKDAIPLLHMVVTGVEVDDLVRVRRHPVPVVRTAPPGGGC
jgi:hypothetical protein